MHLDIYQIISSVLFILNLETPIEKEISMAFLSPSVSWGLKVNWDYRYLITAQDIQEGLKRKAYENTITYMTLEKASLSVSWSFLTIIIHEQPLPSLAAHFFKYFYTIAFRGLNDWRFMIPDLHHSPLFFQWCWKYVSMASNYLKYNKCLKVQPIWSARF